MGQINPILPILPTPQQREFNNSIDQWQKAEQKTVTDNDNLKAALGQMDKEMASGNSQAAFMIAILFVLQDAMTVQGDATSVFADKDKVASSLLGFVSAAQADFNAGGSMNVAQAENFVALLFELQHDVTNSGPGSEYGQYLSPTTKSDMLTALGTIAQAFGITGGWAGNTFTQQADVQKVWFDMHSVFFPKTQKTTPNPAIKQIENGFQTLNASTSSLSTSATTTEQFLANIYNEYQTSLKNLYQATATLNLLAIQNQSQS